MGALDDADDGLLPDAQEILPTKNASCWFFSLSPLIARQIESKDRDNNKDIWMKQPPRLKENHILFLSHKHVKSSRHLEGLEILEECEEAQGLGDAKSTGSQEKHIGDRRCMYYISWIKKDEKGWINKMHP